MKYFKVKNLLKFQHYKERNPPWIKLHRSIFDDYEFECLQDASKLHLMLIWLLASQLDNRIPADTDWLKRKLGVKGKVDIKPLIKSGFIEMEQDASEVLADCMQSADSETETYTPSETETYTPTEADECEIAFEEDWQTYPRKAGDKPKALSSYRKTVGNNLKKNRPLFQQKIQEYVASVKDPGYLKHGETFFRNWEKLVVNTVHPSEDKSFETFQEKEERERQEWLNQPSTLEAIQ